MPVQAYKENIKAARPVRAYVTNAMEVLLIPSHCAETTQEARQEIRERATAFTGLVDYIYPELAKASPDYAYLGEAADKIRAKVKDMDYLVEESAAVVIGDPDDCVRQIKRFEALGVDEILLGIDGIPHDKIMKSLELFGRYVLPHFKHIKEYR